MGERATMVANTYKGAAGGFQGMQCCGKGKCCHILDWAGWLGIILTGLCFVAAAFALANPWFFVSYVQNANISTGTGDAKIFFGISFMQQKYTCCQTSNDRTWLRDVDSTCGATTGNAKDNCEQAVTGFIVGFTLTLVAMLCQLATIFFFTMDMPSIRHITAIVTPVIFAAQIGCIVGLTWDYIDDLNKAAYIDLGGSWTLYAVMIPVVVFSILVIPLSYSAETSVNPNKTGSTQQQPSEQQTYTEHAIEKTTENPIEVPLEQQASEAGEAAWFHQGQGPPEGGARPPAA